MRTFLILAVLFLHASFAHADGPVPEMTKEDVTKILEAQFWKDVRVIAIVNGVSGAKVAAPSLAHALVIGYRDQQWQELKFDAYYDRELGWFTYEQLPGEFRIWNRDGFKQVRLGGPGS